MSEFKKTLSPLVQAVVALDSYFSELERIGNKINSLEMKSQFDFDHAQRLMNRFAECGTGVSHEVINLSTQLNEARARAEILAAGVSERAALLNSRKTEEQKKMEQFGVLADKVRELTTAMSSLKQPPGTTLTDEDRANLTVRLGEFEAQLNPLIEHAQLLRKEAHEAKMKTLAQNADSLTATLQAVHQKIVSLNLPSAPAQ